MYQDRWQHRQCATQKQVTTFYCLGISLFFGQVFFGRIGEFEKKMSSCFHTPLVQGVPVTPPKLPRRRLRIGTCHICRASCTMRCQGCKHTFYCSTICQKKDWPSHSHVCGECYSDDDNDGDTGISLLNRPTNTSTSQPIDTSIHSVLFPK